MNLLLLVPEDHLRANQFQVRGARAHHLQTVIGVRRGQFVHAGLLNGPFGKAEVTNLGDPCVELAFQETEPPLARTGTRLILAMPRPKVLRRLLPQLAALAVDELVLLRTWRVQRSYLESDILQPESYRPLLHEGLMQACLTNEPAVRFEPRFKPYVQDRLPTERVDEFKVVAHPRAPVGFKALGRMNENGSAIIIGPEGGFLDGEVLDLQSAGAIPARLARGILKVETACLVALAQLDVFPPGGEGPQANSIAGST